MRTLRPGHSAQSVKSWQQFLKDRGYLSAEFAIHRQFDEATADATRRFQTDAGRDANASVGPRTVGAAVNLGYEPPGETFEIGPDRGPSLREARPYFLAPLDDETETDEARTRLVSYVRALPSPVTDIYVVSHGWHRNFFDAIAAYDRLSSRLALLIHRRRIRPPQGWNPLFINLHWHSDPGEDNWFDPGGRRDKAGFLAQAESLFTMEEAGARCFVNDFEDLFELFTRMSAPGVKALSSEAIWGMSDRLSGGTSTVRGERIPGILEHYRLSDMPPPKPGEEARTASMAEKVVVAWKCYHETARSRVLVDQTDGPGNFMDPARALRTLFNYVIGAVTTTALLGTLWAVIRWIWARASSSPTIAELPAEDWNPWFAALGWMVIYAAAMFGSWAYLKVRSRPTSREESAATSGSSAIAGSAAGGATGSAVTAARTAAAVGTVESLGIEDVQGRKLTRGSRGILPLAPLAAVLILEMPIFLVISAWLLVNYLLVGSIAKGKNLFDERLDLRGDDLIDRGVPENQIARRLGEARPPGMKPLEKLTAMARGPIHLLRATVAVDSSVNRVADQIDRQLAFFEMQRKGVETGRKAALFLDSFLRDANPPSAPDGEVDHTADSTAAKPRNNLTEPRIHLLGHSFGGLVVANAARHLILQMGREVQSVCLLQGALSSAWFLRETEIRSRIRGALGCIYSRYDVANGFIYPFANQARLAAGAVGLDAGSPVQTRGQHGEFASLPRPPRFDPPVAAPTALNLDASRIIYAGPPTVAGGHDDIFKDDVVNLMWAVTTVKAPIAQAGDATADASPATDAANS